MKQCPKCKRVYNDESLNYCLDDGQTLLLGPALTEPPTKLFTTDPPETDARTEQLYRSGDGPAVSSGAAVNRPRQTSIWVFSSLLVVLIVGGLMAYRFWPAGGKQVDSIAVLPFENKGGDADTDYLSDGLTDSLMYRLSQLPGLAVTPRSTVFRYKGTNVDPIQIGNELGVSAVLSGRIVERGDDLTISVELVDIRRNKLLWGEQYNRKISDLLATQREISQEISEKLRATVTGNSAKPEKHYTENNEAYQLYLKGRFYWDKRTYEGMNKAIGHFEQAIRIDPNFALAYAGLAACYVAPGVRLPPDQAMPKAKAMAKRAIELDDSLPEAHTVLARVYAAYDWDWPSAEREYKRAIELDPRYPIAHQWYGGYLESQGHREAAMAERKLALELDPLSLILNFELGQAYYFARDYDLAVEQYQKTLELDSSFSPALQFLPAALEQQGKLTEAIEAFHRSPVLNVAGEWTMTKAGLGHAYALSGKKEEALAIIEDLKKQSEQQYIPAVSLALVYAGLGDKEQAFAWLEKGYQERGFQMQWLNDEPRWDSLRSDPRFADLVKRIGLNQAVRPTGQGT